MNYAHVFPLIPDTALLFLHLLFLVVPATMCSVTLDDERARTAIRRALAARGWNPADLARAAEADPGTVLDFLNGKRKAQLATRGRIEAALGWAAGSIEDIAAGGDPTVLDAPPPAGPGLSVVPAIVEPPIEDEGDNEVLAAIRRDPDLDETSRAHFMNQYVLLSKLSKLTRQGDPRGLLPYVAHGQRTEPVDVQEERRREDLGKQAARDNPDSPYRDK